MSKRTPAKANGGKPRASSKRNVMVIDASTRLWTQLHEQVLAPRAAELAAIWLSSPEAIAAVVFEVAAGHHEAPLALGWNGKDPIFELTTETAQRLSQKLKRLSPGDRASTWLATPRFGRLFLFVHEGTLCFNFDPKKGYEIEPGTLDQQRMS